MSTFVRVNTYVHSATYITAKMLTSLLMIIRESGLDPARLTTDWTVLELGIRTWILSKHLREVILEVYDPRNVALIGRWDFDIVYDYGSDGEGGMWVDTDAIRFSIRKAGLWPSECTYRLIVDTHPGEGYVQGWSQTTLLSTAGFTRHSIGTTIGAIGAGTSTAYWRRS